MMMKNKMIRALGLSSVAAVGLNMGIANAATLEGNAQVIVLSTINLVETAPLDFGTIAAFADNQATPLGQAVLTLPASGAATTLTWTGTATVANANIVEIVAGSPGIFTVAGAAPNQALTVTTADTDVMTDPSTTSAHTFALSTSGTYMTTNGSANTFTTDTNATGDMVFQVGGTLTTTVTGHAVVGNLQPYDDATYTGNYTVTVIY